VERSRLAAIPLFAGLGDSDLEALAEAATEQRADEGDTVVAADDFGHALYAIESGAASVSADGNQLRTLGPGDVFGEVAVMASGRRTATVVATSPLQLIALFKRDVWELERRAPDVVDRLRALIAERQPT
jgi:CPA1 family monovalent cation:H+ antiporter